MIRVHIERHPHQKASRIVLEGSSPDEALRAEELVGRSVKLLDRSFSRRQVRTYPVRDGAVLELTGVRKETLSVLADVLGRPLFAGCEVVPLVIVRRPVG